MTYMEKILSMHMNGQLPDTDGVGHVSVYHDDDCSVFRNGACNCSPEIKVIHTGDKPDSDCENCDVSGERECVDRQQRNGCGG